VDLRPTRHKIGHFGDVLSSQSLGTEKLKQTQQKQTCVRNKIYYNIKLTKKTKATFSGLLRHSTWKRKGPILVSALHKFVTYLLT